MQTLYPRSTLHLPPASTYYISRPQLDLIINQLFTTYRAHLLTMATTLTSHHTITSHPSTNDHYHETIDDITHSITPMTSTSSPSMTSRPFKSMTASVTSTIADTHSPSFTRIYPPMVVTSHHHHTSCATCEDHFESLPAAVKSATSSSSTSTSIYSSASTQSSSTASSSSSSCSSSTTSSPLQSSRSPSVKSSKSLNHLSSHRSSLSNIDLFAHDSREYGIVLADRDQSITHVNSGFTAITGYQCWESVGRNCNFLQGEKTNYEAVRVMRDSLQHNQTCRVGILNYKKNGEPFWNMLTITPLFDAHGQIHHYVGIQVVTTNNTYVDRPTPLFPWNQTPDAPSASYKQQRLIKSGNGPRRSSVDEGEQEMASYKQRQRGEASSSTSTSTSTTTTHKQPKLKSTPISFVAETNLPTDKGMFRVRAYKDLSKGNNVDSEIMCIIKGDIENSSDVIIRVHDQCYTSEILGSLKCDCRQQLDHAMRYIQEHNGMIIYMPQEGRGIGLANKIKAYSVQELGYDTVDANRVLGFEDDLREYNVVPSILAELGISSVRLITNNPRKIDQLTDLGIQVNGRVPIIMETNVHSHGYIAAKRARMGHHQS